MQGSSHFMIGCACAGAMAFIGYQTGDAGLTAGAILCPVGAMLPDIDHNSTKLGKKRSAVTDTIVTVAKAVSAVFAISVAVKTTRNTGNWKIGLLMGLVSSLPVLVCILLASNEKIKKKFKFFNKHRGIMHTLIPVVGMLYAVPMVGGFIGALLTGLSSGYVSHLVADMETVRGCPVLWPLTDKNISLLPIRTGTIWEKLILLIDLGVILCLTILYLNL